MIQIGPHDYAPRNKAAVYSSFRPREGFRDLVQACTPSSISVPIKAVKNDLPFIVSFFVEYTYCRKIGGAALGHRWEVLDRTQFQEVSALFP